MLRYLCDEIARDEDPKYVQADLEGDLFAYFDRSDFEGKRVLDFGCGSGASTAVLARLFPRAQIVGIELSEDLLSVARRRMEFYKYPNVELHLSPDAAELPENIGQFDFVILSAVYEHMLPQERREMMPKLWNLVRPGGYLFINMTPNSWFPIEHHTTGLPLLNYLPTSLTAQAARRFSKRIAHDASWETLLRQGIRGGTEREVLKDLGGREAGAILLEPGKSGMRDRIDLWYSALNQTRMRPVKQTIKAAMKAVRGMVGLTLVPNLSLAIRKNS